MRGERTLGPRRRSRAFGLDLETSFDVPGLIPVAGGASGPATRVTLVAKQEIDAAWPVEQTTRLLEEHRAIPGLERTIDRHDTAGYRFFASGFGLALVSPEGDVVRCAPAGSETWPWQRFLIGRVLPWTALLRGFELFHASAVEIGGQAVALVGPSGVGKTSLAIQLVLRGAQFMTDDVLAIDRGTDGRLCAHPGASLAGLRSAERSQIPHSELRRLGPLRIHDGKSYATLAGVLSSLPLGAVYFVTRVQSPGGEVIEPLPSPDPSVLLASTFVLTMREPRRLRNLLDLCADFALSVPAFRVRIQPGVGAAAIAEQLAEHARSQLI